VSQREIAQIPLRIGTHIRLIDASQFDLLHQRAVLDGSYLRQHCPQNGEFMVDNIKNSTAKPLTKLENHFMGSNDG